MTITIQSYKHNYYSKAILILLVFSVLVLQIMPLGLKQSDFDSELTSNRPLSVFHRNSDEIEKAAIYAGFKNLPSFLYFIAIGTGISSIDEPSDFMRFIKFLAALCFDYRHLMKKSIVTFTNGNNFK